MNDREVFGLVQGKYRIDGRVVRRSNPVQGVPLLDAVDYLFTVRRWTGGCSDRLLRNNQPPAGNQPGGGKVVPGFQLLDCRIETDGNVSKRIPWTNRVGSDCWRVPTACCGAIDSSGTVVP